MMGTREGGTEEEPQRNLVKIWFHRYINSPRPVFHLKMNNAIIFYDKKLQILMSGFMLFHPLVLLYFSFLSC